MIRLKTSHDVELLRESGHRLSVILAKVAKKVKPGVTTKELDDLAEKLILAGGDKPAFKHYQPEGAPTPYPASLCVSINEEVVHGIPSNRTLEEGDVVTIDLGLNHHGRFTDMAMTLGVGKISAEAKKLIAVTREALAIGVAAAEPGGTVGDVGSVIESLVAENHYGLVTELSGHGVGFAPHEEPYVPNYGKAGKGEKLVPGLVIAIEPMVTLGSGEVDLLEDGYTFITHDGKISAHFEQTVAITEGGVEILTPLPDKI